MTDKYKINEILEAINTILDSNVKTSQVNIKNQKPLELKNEVKNVNNVLENIPKNTEKIILQAEKYLKK
tara:strand:- start:400 stop:606 length:207 start_codon:yes stop_codon:yes gene_type:complete